ncbi:MFS transporter [Streptomyces mirabilis]|uniref:MFS transporter n=1 Tax=Streptomyces mirabilis TaxID=68239 RepID=UPI0036C85B40
MVSLRTYTDLPRNAKILLGGMFVSATGGGMVQPFLIVYLTQYRHLPVATATAALSVIAAASLAGALTSGFAVDQMSLRWAGTVWLTVVAVGTAGFALAVSPWAALGVAAVYGFGLGGGGTVLNAAVAETVPPGGSASELFGAKVAAVNAGIGIGVLVGALVVDLFGSDAFPVMYVIDGVSSLVVIGAFVAMVKATGKVSRAVADRAENPKEVLADDRAFPSTEDPVEGKAPDAPIGIPTEHGSGRLRVLVPTLAAAAVLFTVGYGQIQSSVPLIATAARVSSSALAVTFFVNAVFIVVCQILLATWMRSAAPGRALLWGALSWAAVWAVLLPLVGSDSAVVATALLTLAMSAFAVGEILVGGALPALVNGLADDTNRGRYNSALSLATQTGQVLGPLTGGALLAAGHPGRLVVLLIAGCLAVALTARWIARADLPPNRTEPHAVPLPVD